MRRRLDTVRIDSIKGDPTVVGAYRQSPAPFCPRSRHSMCRPRNRNVELEFLFSTSDSHFLGNRGNFPGIGSSLTGYSGTFGGFSRLGDSLWNRLVFPRGMDNSQTDIRTQAFGRAVATVRRGVISVTAKLGLVTGNPACYCSAHGDSHRGYQDAAGSARRRRRAAAGGVGSRSGRLEIPLRARAGPGRGRGGALRGAALAGGAGPAARKQPGRRWQEQPGEAEGRPARRSGRFAGRRSGPLRWRGRLRGWPSTGSPNGIGRLNSRTSNWPDSVRRTHSCATRSGS